MEHQPGLPQSPYLFIVYLPTIRPASSSVARIAALSGRVPVVIAGSSYRQVSGVDANPVVAGVHNMKPRRNGRPVSDLPREPMGAYRSMISVVELAVATSLSAT
jgi:hypothetical protein